MGLTNWLLGLFYGKSRQKEQSAPGGDFQKQRFNTHLAEVVAAKTGCEAAAVQPPVDRIKAGAIP